MEAVDLLSHPFIEKLADEVWDGPVRVERSLLWFSTSRNIIIQAFNYDIDPANPYEAQRITGKTPQRQKISSFSFSAWRDGINTRYLTHVLASLVLFIFAFIAFF